MNEQHNSSSRENQVWFSRQVLPVKSESKPLSVQMLSDQHFGLGVLALDAGHHSASGLGIDDICHGMVALCCFLSSDLALSVVQKTN